MAPWQHGSMAAWHHGSMAALRKQRLPGKTPAANMEPWDEVAKQAGIRTQ